MTSIKHWLTKSANLQKDANDAKDKADKVEDGGGSSANIEDEYDDWGRKIEKADKTEAGI
jgi:hypothetical protein